MDPLFIRVYLRLLFSLLVMAVLFALLVTPRADQHLRRNLESSLSPPMVMMAQTLAEARAEGRSTSATLARGAKAYSAPVGLVRRRDLRLSPEDEAILDRGAPALVGHSRSPIIYTPIAGTDEVLSVGPLNPSHPLGGARAMLIVSLLIGGMLLGAYLLLYPIKKRLSALASTADRFRDGDLGARAEVGHEDSIGTAARSFNGMADEIQRLLAAQHELLRTVSHELRTPIQRIHFSIEEATSSDDVEARTKAARAMAKDLDELDGLIDELLTYARLRDAESLAHLEVDLGALVTGLCATLSALARGISLDVKAPGRPFVVSAEPKLLRRAISNLIVNAIRHARTRAELSLVEDGGLVVVKVEDDGAGVPEGERDRIFEPFRSSEQSLQRGGRGFGLGLAIVRRVAQRFGGAVDVTTSALGGACFRFALPSATAPLPAPTPEREPHAAWTPAALTEGKT